MSQALRAAGIEPNAANAPAAGRRDEGRAANAWRRRPRARSPGWQSRRNGGRSQAPPRFRARGRTGRPCSPSGIAFACDQALEAAKPDDPGQIVAGEIRAGGHRRRSRRPSARNRAAIGPLGRDQQRLAPIAIESGAERRCEQMRSRGMAREQSAASSSAMAPAGTVPVRRDSSASTSSTSSPVRDRAARRLEAGEAATDDEQAAAPSLPCSARRRRRRAGKRRRGRQPGAARSDRTAAAPSGAAADARRTRAAVDPRAARATASRRTRARISCLASAMQASAMRAIGEVDPALFAPAGMAEGAARPVQPETPPDRRIADSNLLRLQWFSLSSAVGNRCRIIA